MCKNDRFKLKYWWYEGQYINNKESKHNTKDLFYNCYLYAYNSTFSNLSLFNLFLVFVWYFAIGLNVGDNSELIAIFDNPKTELCNQLNGGILQLLLVNYLYH